jgi:hypothetical protein
MPLSSVEAGVALMPLEHQPCQLAFATTRRVCIVDERFATRPVVAWDARQTQYAAPEWGGLCQLTVRTAQCLDNDSNYLIGVFSFG